MARTASCCLRRNYGRAFGDLGTLGDLGLDGEINLLLRRGWPADLVVSHSPDASAGKDWVGAAQVFRKYTSFRVLLALIFGILAMRKASCLVGCLAMSAFAFTRDASAMTPAGAVIHNSAAVSFDMDGASHTVQSNTVETRVAELVSYAVSVVTPTVGGARVGEVLTYTLDITNTGNGDECFVVSQQPNANVAEPVELVAVHVDSDGDGTFNATKDAVIAAGSCGPQIATNRRMRFFALGRMPADTGESQAEFALNVAPHDSGPGYGSVLPGSGDAGADKVIGYDAGASAARMWAQTSKLVVSLVKSQLVSGRAQTTAVTGDVITYSLLFKAGGEGLVKGAVVSDPLPADLGYMPGTLILDGVALSDSSDADAGHSADGLVAVRLPDQVAPFEHTITFQAVVRPQSS
ncbi:MAG: hypothetical protein EON93_05870 [Burkholderiales bacterium]|nr:MAG: hypothetical protein EON93_05870 [Burkholderiales bacterium]